MIQDMVLHPDSWAQILPVGAALLALVLFMGVLVTRGLRNFPADLALQETESHSDALPIEALPYSTPAGSLARRTRDLCDAGDDVGAVVLVCVETGMNQQEAKKFVQAID
jgi:hypothetical protein